MIKIGYVDDKRLHIDEYDPKIHEGKVKCEEGHVLIAKRGEIRMHHFSHRSSDGANCGSKGTSDWHLWWQQRINKNNIEFRFRKDILKIADTVNVIGPNKDILSIVEYQNSVMSSQEFALREKFYTRRDLMSEWGLQDCTAILTWVFNLKNCDIEIDHIFGDIVCFRWLKGTKFMLDAKATSFYDFGKRDLILVHGIHKAHIIETQFVGQLVPIAEFDSFYFDGVLKPELSVDERRMNVHPLADYEAIRDLSKKSLLIEMAKSFYFKGTDKKSKTSKTSKTTKSQISKHEPSKKYTKEDIEKFVSDARRG